MVCHRHCGCSWPFGQCDFSLRDQCWLNFMFSWIDEAHALRRICDTVNIFPQVICLCQGSVFAAYVLNFTWAVCSSDSENLVDKLFGMQICTATLSSGEGVLREERRAEEKSFSSEVYNGLWNSCLETSWARSIFRSKRVAWLLDKQTQVLDVCYVSPCSVSHLRKISMAHAKLRTRSQLPLDHFFPP